MLSSYAIGKEGYGGKTGDGMKARRKKFRTLRLWWVECENWGFCTENKTPNEKINSGESSNALALVYIIPLFCFDCQ